LSVETAAVLDALRRARGGLRSGEDLSNELGVSRTAVWKHVEALRRRGYEVEGARGAGYRLVAVPDRLYPEEVGNGLATVWLGRDIHYFDETDSTNNVAFELAREGAAHGTAVIAERQTAGRGRLGRAFFSPGYRNLYTSIVLRPRLTVMEAPTLILSSAIAVAEAVSATLREATGGTDESAEIEIKWPNDVVLAGLKTSGILMEMSAEATRVAYAILGIGVNLNVERSEFPKEFRDRATSLRAYLQLSGDEQIDRASFTRRLYGTLEEVFDSHDSKGFPALRPRFDAFFKMRGSPVEVTGMNGSRLVGTARDIAEDGALLVERPDGTIERVVAGDVTLRLDPESATRVSGETP
jgi:BirA family biotin operon repressor/biotin-[acetyl-CoA-carboxylase] ligase